MIGLKSRDLARKEGLYLQVTADKGRGLFCHHDIRAGEVIEVAPVIFLNETETECTGKTVLSDYSFSAGGLSDRNKAWFGIDDAEKSRALYMGVASFCNHAASPNAEALREEQPNMVLCVLSATEDIPADREICISYGSGWFFGRKNSRDKDQD